MADVGRYFGVRTRHGCKVVKCQITEHKPSKDEMEERSLRIAVASEYLDPRYDLANHSPDGFNWGYPGSGPSQLALAILADFLEDDELAVRLYHRFKDDVIAKIEGERLVITEETIKAWLEAWSRT